MGMNLRKYFPPGYEYEKESIGAGLLLGMAAVFSLQYFLRLWNMAEALYYIDKDLGKTLIPGVVAASFRQLAAGYAGLFLPYFLFLAAMAAVHYLYYYRETKSIYLMKRLPRPGILMKSCVQAPLLGAAAGVAAMIVLCLLYYGSYLLVIPAECQPRFL